MKKSLSVLLCVVGLCSVAFGCAPKSPDPTQKQGSALVTEVDLSVMSPNMAYATICNMLGHPYDYLGATVTVVGRYDSNGSEESGVYHHALVLEDEMRCCAAGVEFLLADGRDGYPSDGASVKIRGTFSTYAESGDTFCRLMDSVILNN